MVNNKVNTHDIIKGIGAGLCLLDRNFRIMWVNKYQADWFGPAQTILGQKCYERFERRTHVCRGCPTVKVFKTGKVQLAKKRIGITQDGKKRYYQLTVSPIRDNDFKVIYALELVQDVTQNVVQERHNSKVTQRLLRMNRQLDSVNKRLRGSITRLGDITHKLSGYKRVLEKRYRKKGNELTLAKEELQDILKVNRALISTVDLKKVSSLITRLASELINTDACILWIFNEQKKILAVGSIYGANGVMLKNPPTIKFGESIAGRAAKERKPFAVNDIKSEPQLQYKELLKKLGISSLLCVPVIFQKKLLGVISTYSRKIRSFSKSEVQAMSIFASQVAIAMQETQHYDDIRLTYFNTIHTLVLAIEARDPYTRGHTERVTKYALDVARALNMHELDLETLRYAAEVHDIGKISIPDFILNKPGRLNPAERAMIELHPTKGAEMLKPLEFLKPAIPIVLYHHERFDGTGYPEGLEKEDIPVMARIISCADAFDAMTSERPYRNRKLNTEEAILEIKNNAGSQFDPNIARLFIKTICNKTP